MWLLLFCSSSHTCCVCTGHTFVWQWRHCGFCNVHGNLGWVFEHLWCVIKLDLMSDSFVLLGELKCVILATLFLELWKRHRAKHVSKWKVYDWCEEEVRPLAVSAYNKMLHAVVWGLLSYNDWLSLTTNIHSLISKCTHEEFKTFMCA